MYEVNYLYHYGLGSADINYFFCTAFDTKAIWYQSKFGSINEIP